MKSGHAVKISKKATIASIQIGSPELSRMVDDLLAVGKDLVEAQALARDYQLRVKDQRDCLKEALIREGQVEFLSVNMNALRRAL